MSDRIALPITIAGETRTVECGLSVNKQYAQTVFPVALCRIGRSGKKLHATSVFLWRRTDGMWNQDRQGHAMNRNGYIVAWNDAELAAHKSQHRSTSNHVQVEG